MNQKETGELRRRFRPEKSGKAGLGFCPGENEFHNLTASQMVGPPDQSSLVETRVIDGQRYLLVPVSEELTGNGMPVG